MTDTVTNSPIVNQLLKCLEIVEDPRKARGKRHPLEEVLLIASMGCICGCDDAEALEDWGRKEIAWLSQVLPLRHGPPIQDVYLRVFAAIKPETRTKHAAQNLGLIRHFARLIHDRSSAWVQLSCSVCL